MWFWEIAVSKILYILLFLPMYTDNVRKKDNMCSIILIFANIFQYFLNKPSYYIYLTEFQSETLPMCYFGLKH